MRNISNKIRFVAFVVVLLLGTINTWAYRVRFTENGGTTCTDITNAPSQITLPQITKDGCFFVGWFDGSTYVGRGGDTYKVTRNVTLTADWAEIEGTSTIGSDKKLTASGDVYSKGYQISNNQQREFTFINSRRSDVTDRWANWNMWAYSSWRTDYNNRKDYFYMDLAPCVRKHITANDSFWDNYENTDVFIKQDNGELSALTDEQWTQFLADMSDNAYVSVKVSNYDGKIRVYSVMQDKLRRRTYVYPYEYKKYAINGGKDGDVWIHFSVDRTVLTNFSASDAVGVARVGYTLDYTTVYGPRNCSLTITTPEGFELAKGTAVGNGDKVIYKVDLGDKWTFTKWGGGNNHENPRTITIRDSHVSDGWIWPTATLAYSGLNLENDRIFHLDFEGMTDNDLIPVVEYPDGSNDAPTEAPTPDEQGKFYLYGGKGRILSDPIFGKYYQNLAIGTNEYTKSIAQNFLRIILTDEQQDKFVDMKYETSANGNPILKKNPSATIGFWVNASLANKYELPLERGSMFCILSNERFKKADDYVEKPRFMFDMACNGWIYSYMPRNEDNSQWDNFFFYGDTVALSDNPTPSLFGKYYYNAQNQAQHKFYDDDQWHYVTYVAENGLKKVTLYVDGNKCLEKDLTTLDDKLAYFDPDGDYIGRARYLRNIVLGGFTPHGLFFEKQYYSDAALAYDDISIYSRALSQSEIVDIINEKGYSPKEWHFTEAVKANVALDGNWVVYGDPKDKVYELNKSITKENLTSDGQTIFSTQGLKFTKGNGSIYLDLKKGRIGLTRGSGIYVPNVDVGENLYFVAKPEDEDKYPLDHYDLYPYDGTAAHFFTRGVSFYGGEGKEDMSVLVAYKRAALDLNGFRVYHHRNTDENGNNHNVGTNDNILWFSDIMISPYSMVYTYNAGDLFAYNDRTSVHYIDVEITGTTIPNPELPTLILTKGNGQQENLADYRQGNTKKNPYIRYSSSAPRVAYVNQNGEVTLTGLAGYATIKAELVFGNIHDGCISTAYTIRVKETAKTFVVENESNGSESAYKVGGQFTVKANDNSDAITMTLGGWTYTDDYNDIVDSWTNGYGHIAKNDIESIDGITTASVGTQNATSESYNKKDENGVVVSDGSYAPAEVAEANMTPWILPSRGAYLKFEPEKAGVLSVYVLQNGNLDKTDGNNNYSDLIKWRPVYVADETGAIVKDVRVVTNSKISENDNFFKEGRRRAQFLEDVEGTYNQRLKDALIDLRDNQHDRFELLIDNWENAGWKQKVIETGDGGYMVMSKGIVRYTFNVYPGKTYYIFSNHTKVGYSGYHFEEGKLINANGFENNPIRDVVQGSEIVFKDLLNSSSYTQPAFPTGKDITPVSYQRGFAANTWSSICLPFSMNKKQVEENFGEGTSVVIMKKIHDSGELKGKMELVWHTNQDLIAGYPYFIFPTKKISEIKANVTFLDASANPAFAVSSKGITYAYEDTGYDYSSDYPYVFEGNFYDVNIPAGSYVMANTGALTKIKNAVTAKSFRAYVRCVDAANAKPLSSMGFGDSEGETTSIEELLQDNGIILESSDVYGVNGLKVRSNTHSLEGLSKGVYVVNGKKYVVK